MESLFVKIMVTLVTFHCNFNATEKFQGRKVHCEIPCTSPANETKKYTKLVTSTCDMNIVSTTLPPKLPPTPQAKKSFPTLLAILIATSLAGIIGLMLCCVCRKRRKDKREAEQNRESKRPGTRGKTDLPTQTELSQWTSTDATESTGITSETSVTDIEGETAV
ncbi:uncharacterized protein LOC112576339 [Pomacea canaliculata]|uniref:uncharacterized protein LOC112576339 n=1 Tax=Pomacea canaliculata TaxID=400727 RepID=UPI000D7292DB|nr:uncharacterized protein LOC112576339 [Pomacea canaliculata]